MNLPLLVWLPVMWTKKQAALHSKCLISPLSASPTWCEDNKWEVYICSCDVGIVKWCCNDSVHLANVSISGSVDVRGILLHSSLELRCLIEMFIPASTLLTVEILFSRVPSATTAHAGVNMSARSPARHASRCVQCGWSLKVKTTMSPHGLRCRIFYSANSARV